MDYTSWIHEKEINPNIAACLILGQDPLQRAAWQNANTPSNEQEFLSSSSSYENFRKSLQTFVEKKSPYFCSEEVEKIIQLIKDAPQKTLYAYIDQGFAVSNK